MTEESRVSRTPRTWTEGDKHPPRDVKLLRGYHRDHHDEQFLVRCMLGGWVWSHQAGTSQSVGYAWEDQLWLARGPLVEVLPDAPEPRQWTEADIVNDPKDHPAIKDRRGTTWRWFPDRDFYYTDWNEAASWRQLCENLGPLTEVTCECAKGYAVCDPCRAKYYPPIAATSAAGGSSASSLSDDTTRTGKPATEELSGPPEDDKVGTVRRLGNSWFVKLVEPRSEPWHVACSDGQQNVSGWQSNDDMRDCPAVGYVPIAECYTPSEVEAARELYRGIARVHDELLAQINAVLDHPIMPSSEKIGAISVICDAQSLPEPALSGVELRDAEERDDAAGDLP